MNYTCYILDDEPHAITVVKDFICRTPGLVFAGAASHPPKALQEIAATPPDILFLDIDMPEINGLRFASMTHASSQIVFTTAYREYAVEAFEKEAADYLLKPISYERFLTCIQKLRKQQNQQIVSDSKLAQTLFVKIGTRGKLQRIDVQQLRYIHACDHYIELQLGDQKIITYLTLGEILEKLPADSFSRIHKSYIINHNFLQSLEPGQVKLQDQSILPIGRAYRQDFQQKIRKVLLISKWDQAV